ncbi:large conductance mechanosensitive channel protein MscL [Candidatus Campbellbacteria bacterium CG11_big_fil_rev_8_21_14_0_20_44_21]|uniref:Large conductance mechanosensitive channel protein MscL n=1 Tax=Candidatus Campbellbacteria bacterium CG22_combo_CG10-13_8_21_14_all_43_18 TaxID=1974530 RepID=A0A2H0DWD4_9BACT|nr:MAG: large conductance mechanosensitive channel protein MscL [Candidatus Campbellbacteria bacterium CG22_combo_CG10-13_8_21_14_all_43_18]PIR24466.1 MAG: large conductance mechanosensitive channel protein MscL [Candidatus Campbellbacteria bacterium CG11_big_fil_rev_8_21_14_0_20_44_21]
MIQEFENRIEQTTRGFIAFIRGQGVVGLAVGFILGGAVSSLVKSIVDDIINPLIAAGLGNVESLAAVTLGPVALGSFLSALIDFIVIAAVVYWIFKGLKLDRLDGKKE